MKTKTILTLLAAGILSACGKSEQAPPPATPPAGDSTAVQPAPATAPGPEFEKLKGRWLRPDGGYILEIRNVMPDGKLDAAYFNPAPIKVFKAGASRDGAVTKVFIELRDVNYPGSTYDLTWEPAGDQLKGIYFQAVTQQQYDVAFERMK